MYKGHLHPGAAGTDDQRYSFAGMSRIVKGGASRGESFRCDWISLRVSRTRNSRLWTSTLGLKLPYKANITAE